ncbi:MAG TPA: carboxypeptidase regulatory-like domain-containing protein [Gemmatimonadaceae bacterium]|jgi:hypothetical protein
MRGALAATIVWIAVVPAVLAAQRVHGTLRDSASSLPLNGAVVSVVDSAGATTSRTVADGSGAFSLPLNPSAARLHIIRIGYVPRDISLSSDRAGGDVVVMASLNRIPPVLSTVQISSSELCPGSTDRGAAFQVWEQARAGLLATVVTRQTNPADVAALVFQRYVGARDAVITRQSTGSLGGHTSRPFTAAAKPEEFAALGYLAEDSSGVRTYNAPDEEVLLDESFAATHCFHLQPPDSAHVGQFGLAFTPAPGRDTIVDVSGVVWMDAAAPALRAIDFRYTNLEPAAVAAGVGGHVEFRSVGNGASFIDWWNLRLPVLSRAMLHAPVGPQPVETRRRRERADYRVDQLIESGGELLSARWKDGTTWHAQNSGVSGVITQRDTRAPVPFGIVSLAGTADSVMADAQGHFELAPVPPGHYTLEVRDTTLSAYLPGRVAKSRVTISRDSLTTVAPTLQSSAELILAICKDQHTHGTEAVILGHLAASDLRGVEVHATWGTIATPSDAGAISMVTQGSTVDDKGHFVICAGGREQAVHLQIARAGVAADTTVITNQSLLTLVDWSPRAAAPARPKPPEITEFEAPAPDRFSALVARATDTPPQQPRAIATRPRRR